MRSRSRVGKAENRPRQPIYMKQLYDYIIESITPLHDLIVKSSNDPWATFLRHPDWHNMARGIHREMREFGIREYIVYNNRYRQEQYCQVEHLIEKTYEDFYDDRHDSVIVQKLMEFEDPWVDSGDNEGAAFGD
jgi:hypothetical protein